MATIERIRPSSSKLTMSVEVIEAASPDGKSTRIWNAATLPLTVIGPIRRTVNGKDSEDLKNARISACPTLGVEPTGSSWVAPEVKSRITASVSCAATAAT